MAEWDGAISLSALSFSPIEIQLSGLETGPFNRVEVGPFF